MRFMGGFGGVRTVKTVMGCPLEVPCAAMLDVLLLASVVRSIGAVVIFDAAARSMEYTDAST